MPKKSVKNNQTKTYLDKISSEVSDSQSKLSMILGALIILVTAILLFNYFNKGKESLGPSQKTEVEQALGETESKEGKYTVKEGDTLFLIAQRYYKDGYKYSELAKLNNLTNVDQIEVGQILTVPAMENINPEQETPVNKEATLADSIQIPLSEETTEWGSKITTDKYTVTAGDWLSKIAGRAYGDVMAYEKISKANNIADPNLIEPGTVIIIPR